MSHHFVTVCMFCMLCAAHTCGSHVDIQNDGLLKYDHSIDVGHTTLIEDKRRADSKARYQQRLQKIRHKDRAKRELKNVNPNSYVEQIFRLYGDASSMTMNLTGFNRMLEKLDLHKLVEGGVEKTEIIDYIGQTGAKQDIVHVSCLIPYYTMPPSPKLSLY
jgi:hypothetical protein